MKTYMMTLKRMMMMALLLMVTVSAMAAEQNIWLRITGNGKAQVSLDGKTLTFDKDNKATVKGAEGLKVAVSVKPDNGYTVKSVTAQLTIDAGKAETRGADDASFLEVTQSGSDYIFTMPEDFNVVINVIISKKGGDSKNPPTRGMIPSGIYYIASEGNAAEIGKNASNQLVNEPYTYSSSTPESNYYLVPACDPEQTDRKDAYYDGTEGKKPLLTTYKIGQESEPNWNEAVWVVRQVTDDDGTFYYIMHAETGKYVIYEPMFTGNDSRRKCMHLDATQPSDKGKFVIEEYEDGVYDIVPKTMRDNATTTHKFWNIADRNRNSRHGLDGTKYYGGMVGLYSYANKVLDVNSRWKFEKAVPGVSSTVEDKVELTFPVTTSNTKIRYTTNGSDPAVSSTEYTNSTNLTLPAEGNMVVKTIVTVSDGVTPTPNTTSSAIVTMLYKPDITLSQDTYTYNGGENKPTISTVSIATTEGTTTAEASAYSAPTYGSDVTNVGTPTVTITDADENDLWYIWNASTTFIIAPKAVTITASDASKEYDGMALTAASITAPSLEEGDTHEFTVTMTEGSTITNVGTTPNVIATVDDVAVTTGTETTVGNYLVTTENGTLTVSKKNLNKDDNGTPADDINIDLTKSDDEEKPYNITVTVGATILEEGVDGEDEAAKKDFTWTSGEPSADGVVEITLTGHGNYQGSATAKYVNLNFYDDSPNDLAKTETAAVYYFASENEEDKGLQAVGEIEAWYVTAVDAANKIITIQKVEAGEDKVNYIPKNQPLLLLGNAASKGFMIKPYTGEETVTISEGENLLKKAPVGGVSVTQKGFYVFHEGEFVLSMWGDGKSISAGHYYVDLTVSPAPTRMAIAKSNANTRTGIHGITEDVNKETRNETWYTIDGRRLIRKPTQKGIYITNGRKVIIK